MIVTGPDGKVTPEAKKVLDEMVDEINARRPIQMKWEDPDKEAELKAFLKNVPGKTAGQNPTWEKLRHLSLRFLTLQRFNPIQTIPLI